MEVYEYMESVKRMPRVLLAGANSGCGKTSITCGILKALVNRGLHIQSYKCGPDYIDPMLHSHITGRDCRNLDPFFSTGQDLRYLVGKDSQDVDFSVTEGVMGYYDGVGISCEKSTWTVSKETGTPTILIFNVKGMSHTMIPLIKGMIEYVSSLSNDSILNNIPAVPQFIVRYLKSSEKEKRIIENQVTSYQDIKEQI